MKAVTSWLTTFGSICAGTLERSFDMSKSKPARSVRLRSARKARSKKAVGHQPQTKFSSTSHDEEVSWRRALANAAEEAHRI